MKLSDILIFLGLALAFIGGGFWSIPCIMIFCSIGIALLYLGVTLQEHEDEKDY